jgi:hypothetical protein
MAGKKFKKLNCCEKCQNYWTCETKWHRGESNQENICCSLCNFYETCWGTNTVRSQKRIKKI